LGRFLRQAGLFAAKAAPANTQVKGTLAFIISRDLFAV